MLAVFCQRRHRSGMHFNPELWRTTADEYGQILCGEGQRILMAVGFDWELVQPVLEPAQTANPMSGSALPQLNIRLTLTTRLHPMYANRKSSWLKDGQSPPTSGALPWAPLAASAFQPTLFTLTLEKGRFVEPFHTFHRKAFPLFQPDPYRFAPSRYAHRITFDKSPFPPLEAWLPEETHQPGAVKACLSSCRFWEYRELVRELVPKSEETWAEALSLRWWLSSETGGAHASG